MVIAFFIISFIQLRCPGLSCVAVGHESRCAVDCGWLSISPVKWHTDLCAAASGHVPSCPHCPGWHRCGTSPLLLSLLPLQLGAAAMGGRYEVAHQELSSTRLLCCISCHAPINKCSMYCLETSVVRKVKSFLMWTNIKSLAQITLCMYFHCQLCIYRILVQHFWQLEIE